jgi:hypothetical protein
LALAAWLSSRGSCGGHFIGTAPRFDCAIDQPSEA